MSLSVQTLGDGVQELVFVHGWAFNKAVWESTARRLAAHYRCVLVDLPGHGDSPASDSKCSLSSIALSVAAQVNADSVWIGWSLGGMVAMQAALDSPAKVKSLSLVASTPRFTQADDWPCGIPSRDLAEFSRDLETDLPRTMARFITLQVLGSPDARAVTRELRRSIEAARQPDPAALRAGLDILLHKDLRESIGSLRCPVQVLLGERDALVPKTLAAALRRLCPEWNTTLLAGATHVPFLSHPTEYERSLVDFVRETP